MKVVFYLLLLIFGVVEVLLLIKYLDQSMLHQKINSKIFPRIQQDISSTNINENPSKNVKKEEDTKDTELILKKVGPCDCLKLIDLGISDEFINSTTCSKVGSTYMKMNTKPKNTKFPVVCNSSIILFYEFKFQASAISGKYHRNVISYSYYEQDISRYEIYF